MFKKIYRLTFYGSSILGFQLLSSLDLGLDHNRLPVRAFHLNLNRFLVIIKVVKKFRTCDFRHILFRFSPFLSKKIISLFDSSREQNPVLSPTSFLLFLCITLFLFSTVLYLIFVSFNINLYPIIIIVKLERT